MKNTKLKKRVLITGGNGFIGKNLVEGLSELYEIKSPSSKELDLLNDDYVSSYLKKNKFDTIIHCATYNATSVSDKDLSQVFSNNIRMFINIARLKQYYKRLIYFGSGAEYDNRYYVSRMKEDYFDNHVPSDSYGFSKYIMAKYTEQENNIVDLRIFGCFGKYEDWRIRFISTAICRAIYNQPIMLRKNVFFDYLYIDDLASIVERFIKKQKLHYKFYNVCTGVTVDLLSLAKIVKKISGKKIQIKVLESGLKPEYSGDNDRLLDEFGEIKFKALQSSILELYKWYEERKDQIDVSKIL